MSHLSPQECTAGISRRALASLKSNGSNGNGDNHPPQLPEAPQAVRSISDGTTEIPVIQTPYRRLSVLEKFTDGTVLIRDAEFIGNKCDVHLIHLEYEQAHKLATILSSLQERSQRA